MSLSTRTLLVGLPALLASLYAAAQATAQRSVQPAPSSGTYTSAFESYRPFAAEEIQDWRRSNDTVREIGGWRAYAREISAGQGQSTQPAAKGQAPAADGAQTTKPANPHEGHR